MAQKQALRGLHAWGLELLPLGAGGIDSVS